MEDIHNTEVVGCTENSDKNLQNMEENPGKMQDLSPSFLTASDLFLKRGNMCKSKSKDEDLELYKGPKLYYPDESTSAEEIVDDIIQDTRRNLELQRIAKNRDCVQAEWDEELKLAIVPYLKGKTTQHMGFSLRGKCALSPEEAIYLLEKGYIEVVHDKMSLSVEESYAMMLKEKLSVEKYEVYSFLSQQGFIVINHQIRTGSNYEKIKNLYNMKGKKRKADDELVELPEQKRLTFTGVLASNSNVNSVSNKNSDHMLNKSELHNKMQTDNTLNENIISQDTNGKVNSEESEDTTISPDSTYIEFNNSIEKGVNVSCFKAQTNVNEEIPNDVIVCSKDIVNSDSVNKSTNEQNSKNDITDKLSTENANDDKNETINEQSHISKIDVGHGHDDEIDVENVHDNHDIDVENVHDNHDIDVEHVHDKHDIDVEKISDKKEIEHSNIDNTEVNVENANDDDTNEIIIDDEQKTDRSVDVNIEDSLTNCDNEEYISSDSSSPLVCEESSEGSIDVYSYSPEGFQHAVNSKQDNLCNRPDEQDDEVTLVEVKKKVNKPLAVIDLLSDEEDESRKNNSNADHEDKTNGEEMFEDSDEEIQVLDIFPVSTNNVQGTSRTSNSIKLESRKLKMQVDTSNVKCSYRAQMKFPDAFRKEIICVSRPPNHLLPLHVQPAKEAYVLSIEKSQPRQRVWNSFRDLQDYQRERRLDRQSNSFNSRSGPFRDQVDSFHNTFNTPENSREDNFNRSNFSLQQSRNLYQPANHHERQGGLLPTPNAYSSQNPMGYNSYSPQNPMPNAINPQNPMSFSMNIHNLQNLSASNPVAFVNEIQKTVYSVATSMISSMFGHPLNPNPSCSTQSPVFGESSMMGFTSHLNNFAPSSGPMGYNSSGRSEFNPVRFPPLPTYSNERNSYPMSSPYIPETNWRQPHNFRQGNFNQRGPLFPCKYRTVRNKRDWHDVKSAVVGTEESDSGSDIEEVPINLNQFLWSNDIQPLVKPGSKLPVADVLKALRITQMANLCDTKHHNDRYLPTTPSLEISFDVYLPNSKYKKSEPTTPKYRIIIVRSSDPIPRYSELVYLQRKWNDGSSLQIAVVDHNDISFYSFNSVTVPDVIPFES